MFHYFFAGKKAIGECAQVLNTHYLCTYLGEQLELSLFAKIISKNLCAY